MSKIGRKPVDIGSVHVEIKGQEIHYKGKKSSGIYTVPNELVPNLENKKIFLKTIDKSDLSLRELNRVWGLARALLANAIKGSDTPFEKEVQINGLGFKAALAGQKVAFTLGYSHKIDFDLPKEVSLEIDKTGQKLLFRSSDRFILGDVCSKVRALRPPEPYKGTGIRVANEFIARKAGKTKAA
jgi:large subunit ribosomal protein L6